MRDTKTVIDEVYAAFNRRDVEGVLSRMRADVDWPKASEGGRVVGKDGIREYWARQWAEFDPHVEPMHVVDRGNGTAIVKVHQQVKDRQGTMLSDAVIWHVYSIQDGWITRMDIFDHEPG